MWKITLNFELSIENLCEWFLTLAGLFAHLSLMVYLWYLTCKFSSQFQHDIRRKSYVQKTYDGKSSWSSIVVIEGGFFFFSFLMWYSFKLSWLTTRNLERFWAELEINRSWELKSYNSDTRLVSPWSPFHPAVRSKRLSIRQQIQWVHLNRPKFFILFCWYINTISEEREKALTGKSIVRFK